MIATARIDLADDPEFTGGFSPEAHFIDDAGRARFFCIFHLDVGDDSASDHAAIPATDELAEGKDREP